MSETTDESALIAALRDGDQAAFAKLVNQHTPALLRVARGYVPNHAIAEEVVQETWIALIKGITTFEGRSSLRTWLFVVMTNIAKARGVREHRDKEALLALMGPTVEPSRFHGLGDPRAGAWKEPPGGVSRLAGRIGPGAGTSGGRPTRVGQAASPSTRRRDVARHDRYRLRGGVSSPRHQRGESASPAASRARGDSSNSRELRAGTRMTTIIALGVPGEMITGICRCCR